jgi:hypothetical protein
MSAVKCIARNSPVRIWVMRQIPNRDPKFHQELMLEGVGRSVREELMIFKIGLTLRILVINIR